MNFRRLALYKQSSLERSGAYSLTLSRWLAYGPARLIDLASERSRVRAWESSLRDEEDPSMFKYVSSTIVASAIATVLLCASSVAKADTSGTVQGVVKSSSGQPLAGAY